MLLLQHIPFCSKVALYRRGREVGAKESNEQRFLSFIVKHWLLVPGPSVPTSRVLVAEIFWPRQFEFILLQAVLLHHVELGGSGLPPLLLLHGLLGSSRNWQTTGRDLAEHFHVYALDARNHGRSPHVPDTTPEVMMEDVAAWMDVHGVPVATVIGHSMGGRTAMIMACRRPQLVSRLVVVDVAPRNYSGLSHWTHFESLQALDLTLLRSRQDAEDKLAGSIPDLGLRKFLVTNLAQDNAGQWHWTVNLRALAAALPALEASPLKPEDRYDGPTLFIRGGLSAYVQESDSAAIWNHFPQADIVTIAGSGHNPHIDQRAVFVQAVLAER